MIKFQNVLIRELKAYYSTAIKDKMELNMIMNDINKCLIDTNTLHITLNAIYIDSNDDDSIYNIISIFENFGKTKLQQIIPTKLSCRLTLENISHFRNKVLYCDIKDDINKNKLENVFYSLFGEFKKNGYIYNTKTFEPHLTIMKLSKVNHKYSKNKQLIINDKVINILKTKYNLIFGHQFITGIELLSMKDDRNESEMELYNDDQDLNYYQCISKIEPAKLH